MNVVDFDCAGKEWTSALVYTARHKVGKPKLCICSPYLFHELTLQGYSLKEFEMHQPVMPEAYKEGTEDGFIIWQTVLGLPDDTFLVSNSDTLCVAHGFTINENNRRKI